jgi:hypothetical protein
MKGELIMKTKPVMPHFCFARRRDIELEGGFTLAGQLIVDLPKNYHLRMDKETSSIVQKLVAMAKSGELPDDAVIFGWRAGRKPPNAVDVNDDALMEAWAKDKLTIAVRIDPRPGSGIMRIDSDVMRQMGLTPNAEGKAQ